MKETSLGAHALPAVMREHFLSAARRVGAEIVSYQHSHLGPDGETIGLDAVWLGPANADSAVIVISGVHGVEGLAGSAVQTFWLNVLERAPNVGVLLIHGANPYGFAWCRRVDECNVDLNRNFIRFEDRWPDNKEYHENANVIAPREHQFPQPVAADPIFAEWLARDGIVKVQRAVTQGQHVYPDGLFFGGHRPSWSRVTIERVVRDFVWGCKQVCVLDLHTGLGAKGESQLMCLARSHGSAIGKLEHSVDIESNRALSSVLTGSLACWMQDFLDVDYTGYVLEFGTVSPFEVFDALRAENWLSRMPSDVAEPFRSRVWSMMLDAFFPQHRTWLTPVTSTGARTINEVIASLAIT